MKIQMPPVVKTIVMVCMLTALFACHDEHIDSSPALTSFAPESAYEGDTLVISGSNFTADVATNAVTFNGLQATVVQAGKTSLAVVVPSGVTNGKIAVTSNGKTVTSTSDFTVRTSVYIVGNVYQPNGFVVDGTYWQDGVKTALPGVSGSTYMSGVFLHGKDVYYSGTYNDGGNGTVAAYWKNGVITKLTDSNLHSAQAQAIYVTTQGDVYVAGTFDTKAAYWKNGTLNLLTDGTNDDGCQVYAIAVSGSDVYVGGAQYIHNYVAKYWKNGKDKALSDGKHDGAIRSIVIAGGDVHMSGTDGIDAIYWKNDVPTILSRTGAKDAEAYGMFLSGNDVYICGGTEIGSDAFGIFWKNGVQTIAQDAIWFNSIFVHNTDVYLAGTNKKVAPAYWKNQVSTPLNDGTTQGGAFAIAVR